MQTEEFHEYKPTPPPKAAAVWPRESLEDPEISNDGGRNEEAQRAKVDQALVDGHVPDRPLADAKDVQLDVPQQRQRLRKRHGEAE